LRELLIPVVSTVASTPLLPPLPPAPILPLREPLLPKEHLPRRYQPPRRLWTSLTFGKACSRWRLARQPCQNS